MKRMVIRVNESIDICSMCAYSPPSSLNGGCCICPAVGRDAVNEYDMIRAMSDSEMKDWICSLWDVASHMGMLRSNTEIQEAAKKVADEAMKRHEEYMSKTVNLFLENDMEDSFGG